MIECLNILEKCKQLENVGQFWTILNTLENVTNCKHVGQFWEQIEKNLRDCLRLGFIKTNYIEVAQNHPYAKYIYVIDYAGNFIEDTSEAYDDYHKNPKGNEVFAKRIFPQLLKAFNSFGLLNTNN